MKTNFLLLTVVFVIITGKIFAQVSYEKSFGGSNSELQTDLKKMRSNGYLVTGSSKSFGNGDSDAYCIRLGRNGTMLWSKVYGTSSEEFGTKCWATNDGGFMLAFGSRRRNGKDSCTFITKCDKDGNIQWSKEIKNTKLISSSPEYIYQSKQGDYYLLCIRNQQFVYDNFSILKLNNSGDLAWEKEIDSKSSSEFIAGQIAETNNGDIIVSGASQGDEFGTFGSYIILYIFSQKNGDIKQCKKVCSANCFIYTELSPENFYLQNDTIFISGRYSPDNYFTNYTCWFSFKLNDTPIAAKYNLRKDYNSIQYLINKKFIKQSEQGYLPYLLFTDDGGYLYSYENQNQSTSYDIYADKYDSIGHICSRNNIVAIDTNIYNVNFFLYNKDYRILSDSVTVSEAIIRTKDVTEQKILCIDNLITSNKKSNQSDALSSKINSSTFIVYPNPAKDFVTVNLKLNTSSLLQFEIFSIEGKNVISKSFNVNKGSTQIKIDIKNLQAGIYYIKIDGLDKPVILKFLKEG
ncbi:MAG: T9SS type A sorting domain-containing protein [Parafilimonas sp.]